MNITIELTGLGPLAEAINNLADAMKAGAKADEVIASARTRAKKQKTEEASAPTEATTVVTNAVQAPAAVEEKVEASPEPATPAAQESATASAPDKATIQAQEVAAPTTEDARKAILAVAKAKGHDAAAELLAKFGAKKISDVKAEDYVALIAAAKGE